MVAIDDVTAERPAYWKTHQAKELAKLDDLLNKKQAKTQVEAYQQVDAQMSPK